MACAVWGWRGGGEGVPPVLVLSGGRGREVEGGEIPSSWFILEEGGGEVPHVLVLPRGRDGTPCSGPVWEGGKGTPPVLVLSGGKGRGVEGRSTLVLVLSKGGGGRVTPVLVLSWGRREGVFLS